MTKMSHFLFFLTNGLFRIKKIIKLEFSCSWVSGVQADQSDIFVQESRNAETELDATGSNIWKELPKTNVFNDSNSKRAK